MVLTRTGYICGTDLDCEMAAEDMIGSCKLYPNPEQAKEISCANSCGIAEVEIRFVKWLVEPGLHENQ